MSCWDSLCGTASPETRSHAADKYQQHQRRRFGNGGIRTGTRAAAGGLAEVDAPDVVIAGIDLIIAVAVAANPAPIGPPLRERGGA